MRFVIIKDKERSPGDIETKSVKAVADVLDDFGKVRVFDFDFSLIEKLKKDDIIFNFAEGERHDFMQAKIAAILEAFNMEFIGSPAYTHYICLDKVATKALLKTYGVLTPTGAVYNGKEFVGDIPTPPIMVKPIAEGWGIGVGPDSLCEDVETAKVVARRKFEKFNEAIILEEYIEGIELTVGLIGSSNEVEVLPPLEIDFSNLPQGVERYYSQRVKEEYDTQTVYKCPAPLSDKNLQKAKEVAKKAFKIVKGRDFLRVDMRLDRDRLYIIEVNSMPGLDPEYSDLPKMSKAISKDYKWLIEKITQRALQK